MVIHDLKHPTELVIASLNKVLTQLQGMESHFHKLQTEKNAIKDFNTQLYQEMSKIENFVANVASLIKLEVPIMQFRSYEQEISGDAERGEGVSYQNFSLGQEVPDQIEEVKEWGVLPQRCLQAVEDETIQFELTDFDEGDDKQSPEHRVVIPRDNHQRLKFDVKSKHFQNFQNDM